MYTAQADHHSEKTGVTQLTNFNEISARQVNSCCADIHSFQKQSNQLTLVNRYCVARQDHLAQAICRKTSTWINLLLAISNTRLLVNNYSLHCGRHCCIEFQSFLESPCFRNKLTSLLLTAATLCLRLQLTIIFSVDSSLSYHTFLNILSIFWSVAFRKWINKMNKIDPRTQEDNLKILRVLCNETR